MPPRRLLTARRLATCALEQPIAQQVAAANARGFALSADGKDAGPTAAFSAAFAQVFSQDLSNLEFWLGSIFLKPGGAFSRVPNSLIIFGAQEETREKYFARSRVGRYRWVRRTVL